MRDWEADRELWRQAHRNPLMCEIPPEKQREMREECAEALAYWLAEVKRLREAFTTFIHAHCPNDPCMECGGGLDPQSAIVCNKEALENAINAVVLKEVPDA